MRDVAVPRTFMHHALDTTININELFVTKKGQKMPIE